MSPTDLRTEVDGRAVALTNLDKPLYPNGFTKAEVVDHYLRVADVMLPHLASRCLTRLRFPEGTERASFYEKNLPAGAPDWVITRTVQASEAIVDYPLADSPATLVWLANLAALEIHTPQWRCDDVVDVDPAVAIDLEAPGRVLADRLVIDLDPGEGTTMADSAQAAMLVATELAGEGLVPFVKTSGSKGLQVFCAIVPTPWQQVLEHVRALGERLVQRHPDRFVTVMAKQVRTERIFVDVLQNRAARNTIAPYSLRGKQVDSVSTPVTWEEVAEAAHGAPLAFTSGQVHARIDRLGDLWADLLDPALAAELPVSSGQ